MELETILQKLKLEGYRLTPQRKSIIQALVCSSKTVISAEQLLPKVQLLYPKTNLSTIYRNLELLEHLCLIHKIFHKDGTSVYQLNSLNDHHHHIICKKCGKSETIEFCPLAELIALSHKKNFILTDHKIELYGYCKNCRPH